MASSGRGLPGLRGGEHIGITVPNLTEAVRFFTEVIGCDFVFDGGEFGGDPEFMRDSLGVDPAARLKYCFLRCGFGLNFEVFEYCAPDQHRAPPRNSDIGGHHIAFYVDDIDAAVAHLRGHGVAIQGNPQYIETGNAAGSWWVYFLAPWGLQLELVSYPNGKAYEKNANDILWNPRVPSR